MQVVLNISDEQFDAVVKDQLAAISPEDMHDAMLKALNDYFANNPQAVERLVFPYNSYERYHEPSQLLRDMVKTCDFSGLQPMVDACIKTVTENHKNILRDILLNQMTETLMNTYSFKEQLRSAIACEVNSFNNRNSQ